MKAKAHQLKLYFTNRDFMISSALAFVMLAVSMVVNYFAVYYAADRASNPVTDIILSNIPVYDMHLSFIYGPWVLWAFVGLVLVWRPKYIPFTVLSLALFTLIRAGFVSMTHIGQFPDEIPIDPTSLMSNFASGADLFFSGHTGSPFLMALVFWEHKYLRPIFAGAAIYFGAVVLLSHLHYSIDVAAAFFITYTIYEIAKKLFKHDYKIFVEGI